MTWRAERLRDSVTRRVPGALNHSSSAETILLVVFITTTMVMQKSVMLAVSANSAA